MIGAGMAHNDFLQVTKDTQAAEHAFKSSVEKGHLFDVSEDLKQDLQGAELNVFKQNSPMMNMQAQKTEQLLNSISVLEKRLKQLSGQKTKAESNLNPVSFSAEPNRVDTFHRGTDLALYHKWSINGKWSGWENLGGVLKSDPTVISERPNHLEVFVKGLDKAVWHKQWDQGRWSNWESLGGQWISNPAVVSWDSDRADVFVRGTDNNMWHKWCIRGGWSDWQNLGGVLTSAPTVISQRPNQILVFIKGTDNALWH